MTGARPLADERGITIVELLVSMLIGLTVLGGIVTLVTVTARSSGRVSERVAADQIARPMMTRIMNELHSTCVSPGLAPILAGSDGSSVSFIHGTGSAVAVTPAKRTVELNGDVLTDSTYERTGGTAPNWTFATSPSQTYKLLENVGTIDSTPVFRYYAYENGVIATDPLPTPLSDDDAARTVEVAVAISVSPSKSGTSGEEGAPVQLSDSAFVRFSPSNEDTEEAGLPCS
ncbi:MAG: hypothetical protein EDQ89_06805 [Acidobacteria bacterium]|nr:MAG: hypothetical protein EDQ89_06805 [Acidobacteriota bacterium]MCL4286689.1 hypothetical protein [Thermoleophilia bacterium]GIK77374.1 MAG: hypothetical protein BroJett022_10640 [Actinomycetes bacterium]